MATYRVLEKSFIGNAIREEGDIVEYDGEPSPNLELVKPAKPGKAKPVQADDSDTE